MLHAYNMNCHILSYPKYFHLIFCNETHNRIIRFITSDIIKGITNVHTGLSGACNTLSKLDTCCHQSVFTCMMAHNTGLPYYDYETMGFYKVLFAVNDRLVLSDYVEQYLGKLKEYDNRHNSEYTETLHQYLLHNGSIQTIANEMNCHRNTINYRINILKESFGFDPDNQQKKFELMCAYTINDFLKLCFIENGV